MLAWLQD